MPIEGQGIQEYQTGCSDDRGYIMVALLIGIAVSAVWMGALLPAWRHQTTRDKEADLIFRGEAYARGIALFFVKNQRLPPNLDVLVEQRYVRKKYLDPITNKEFIPVGGAQPLAAGPTSAGRGQSPGVTVPPVPAFAGVFGVRSTSTAASIIVYQGQTTHSQFPFDYQVALQRMGTRVGTPGPLTQPGRGGAPGRGELPPVGPGRGGRGPGSRGAPFALPGRAGQTGTIIAPPTSSTAQPSDRLLR